MLVTIIPTWDLERAATTANLLLSNCELLDSRCVIVTPHGNECAVPRGTRVTISGERLGVLQAMQLGAATTTADYLCFLHDDVDILDKGWDRVVTRYFMLHPKMGLCGFGGAKGLGNDDIYQTPYRLQQLARHNFMSNMKEWMIHGRKTLRPQQVATLDGMSLIFRRQFYKDMGEWQGAIDKGYPYHHNYDNYAACMAARLGWETWLIPIYCHHHGGITATSSEYMEWLREHGWKNDSEVHAKSHEVLYNEFRDVLPIRR